MAINSRSKGQRGEREVRDILQKVMDEVGKEMELPFVPEIKRNLMQSMIGGFDLVDIPGLAVEVKFQENQQVDKWWEQTTEQALKYGGIPVLIHRKKNARWRVRMLAALDEVQIKADFTMDEFLTWFEGHLKRFWKKQPT